MPDFLDGLISDMTLEEKAAQLGGVEARRLVDEDNRFSPERAGEYLANGIGEVSGLAYTMDIRPDDVLRLTQEIQSWIRENTRSRIPALFHEECLSGLAGKCAPIYPHPIGLGCIWEPELIKKMAGTIRLLARSMGINHGLSPVLDISYDQRFGRNEEMYGEDAYLVAANACAFIGGLQGDDLRRGIAATAKHFAGHAMCEGGRNCAPVHIGSRELHDTVLFPFEAAVKTAGVKTVMNAYHDIDGIPCVSSKELLRVLLRDIWGFHGVICSDYRSVERLLSHHATAENKTDAAIQALEAGVDMELPALDCYAGLPDAIKTGAVTETLVDDAVRRVLRLKQELGLFDCSGRQTAPKHYYMSRESILLSREMAGKSIVLLKNADGILPLDRRKLNCIAVIGPGAASRRDLLGDYSYFASISARLNLPDDEGLIEDTAGRTIPTILECIQDKLDAGTEARYAAGCGLFSDDRSGIEEAADLARASDVAIVVVGERSGMFEGGTTGENIDRVSVELYGAQQALVEAVADTGVPVILILVNGRPLIVTNPVAVSKAVVEAWVPGEQGGRALADILFGDCNPSGKLSVSLLQHQGQHPLPYCLRKVNYQKNYFDCSMEPLFPFGHGLSYTTFEYSNFRISPHTLSGRGVITARVEIQNTGPKDGEDVVQIYFSDAVASVSRPAKLLIGFQRVAVLSGETKTLVFTVHTDQFAFCNKDMKRVVEPGEYMLMVGASSADIKSSRSFELLGAGYEAGDDRVFFSTCIEEDGTL